MNNKLHSALDRFNHFVDTRPRLYMTFVIAFIFFALGVVGEMEREPQTIIAQQEQTQ